MDPERARHFLADHHRAVLCTFRADDLPQMSPILCGLDEGGRVVVSTRETALKVANIHHRADVSLCVLDDDFFGDWVQVDGRAEIVPLPEAMEGLVGLYRQIAGEHPDWDDYRSAMKRERRVLLRLHVERAGPNRRG